MLGLIKLIPLLIQKNYKPTLKEEVDRLIKIEIFKKLINSNFHLSHLLYLRKNNTVRFISDYRELNKTITNKPFPVPKI